MTSSRIPLRMILIHTNTLKLSSYKISEVESIDYRDQQWKLDHVDKTNTLLIFTFTDLVTVCIINCIDLCLL
jgi:hypothetical protein